MEVIIKTWPQLSKEELYQVLGLRVKVFVVEQECAYQEVDQHDQTAIHLLGFDNEKLVAYARIVAPGTVYNEPSIGRVAVEKEHRNKGYGREIFTHSLEKAKQLYPKQTLKIQAQTYLEDFYKSFGFRTISKPYPDVGIWHIDMIKKL